MLLPMQQSY